MEHVHVHSGRLRRASNCWLFTALSWPGGSSFFLPSSALARSFVSPPLIVALSAFVAVGFIRGLRLEQRQVSCNAVLRLFFDVVFDICLTVFAVFADSGAHFNQESVVLELMRILQVFHENLH